MRDDLVPGNPFPDLRLPEHTGRELSLSEIAAGQPLVLCFVRGWWCPKDQVRVRMLVSMQDEVQREYGQIAVVTVDSPYVNGAFRAGIGADFPFLSDERREVAEELDLLELTDAKHRPFLPLTFVLDSNLRIHGSWCGFSWCLRSMFNRHRDAAGRHCGVMRGTALAPYRPSSAR